MFGWSQERMEMAGGLDVPEEIQTFWLLRRRVFCSPLLADGRRVALRCRRGCVVGGRYGKSGRHDC